ncbi:SAM-dependent methyltransferase [Actinoallomurus rhizosphaericola]|uniref:SAM-dependent methyltransferase n=1 Tax=Actinoallomurus rhizosphaericola TaxID=2952536 RepID=UPI0020939B7D|nr:SAM-dependent methyltransferase [Actinoallomurus rhizosphaericola]MCO5998515.1 SAM-dependent methyltransferase [Actinoallomurus rhizosphaericola]
MTERPPPGIDVSVPNVARMYDYWLGGKDNFAADRTAAEEVIRISEGRVLRGVKLNRSFLGRAVRTALDAGVRQFLDLGSGLPTRENVHEVALRVDPEARVVYVDNDPVVRLHGEALLSREGRTRFVQEDLRRVEEILGHPDVRAVIDLGRPVAVMLVSVLHFVPDEDDPWAIVARYREAMAPGSHLILSHLSSDPHPEKMARAERVYEGASARLGARSRDAILRFFDGFDVLEPGLVGPTEWRPERDEAAREKFAGVVGVAVKR